MRRARSMLAVLMMMVALMTTIAVPAMAAQRGEGRHDARIDKRFGLTEGSRADRLQDRGSRSFGNCGFNRFNCFNGNCFNSGFNNGFNNGITCNNGTCFNDGFNDGFNCGFGF